MLLLCLGFLFNLAASGTGDGDNDKDSDRVNDNGETEVDLLCSMLLRELLICEGAVEDFGIISKS